MNAPLLTLSQLLACGAALLLLMAAMSWFVLRQDRTDQQLSGRIEAVAAPYAQARLLPGSGRGRAVRSGGVWLRSACARLFGYDPARAVQYKAKPAVVLLATLVVSLVLSHGAGALVGRTVELAAPVLWVVASRRVFGWFERRHAARLYAQFPDALAMIVRSVRVGIAVNEAIRGVSREALEPTATEFTLLGDHISIGVPLDEALRRVAARNRLPEYRFFATALSLQAQTGGGLSDTLEGLADVIRKRVAVRNRAHAMASEARLSTYILAALPVFTGLALSVINPDYIGLLFTDPTGKGVLAAAIVMLGTGMFMMRATISRSLR